MTQSKPAAAPRSHSTLAAFVLGLPLAAGAFALVLNTPLAETSLKRYLTHPVEIAEILMFCIALGALTTKLWAYLIERRACRATIVPAWQGRAVAVEEAGKLLEHVDRLPRRWHRTMIVKRAVGVLAFLRSRGSAAELDDHLRTLADNDALALETSYSLTKFICWAMPILGFLGTVLGITQAIAGVTPEVLEKSLSTVTDGLALAFDTTALALGLTMITMMLSFVVERAEQGILETVDQFADRELAHRFERAGVEGGEFAGIVRQHTEVLVTATETLVEQQVAIWAKALTDTDQRRFEAEQRGHERLTAGLEAALERTLETHDSRLQALENRVVDQSSALVAQLAALTSVIRDMGREHQLGLAQVSQGIAAQIASLARLQEGEQQLRHAQELLNQNLAALAGAGAFDEAVHSLTAAVHLLTARAAPAGGSMRLPPRSGEAA